jgi:sulfane dehydrogenase subunit SoxC
MLAAGSAGIASLALPAGAQTQDTTKVQGPAGRDVGARSPFEKPARLAFSPARSATFTPLQDLDGIITPSDLHFERHHAGVPAVDPQQYSLLIHGLVDRPTIFTLADLKRFPGTSIIRFIECSGNGGRAYRLTTPTADLSPQQTDGLTSTSEWSGVRLATLLREVGVSPKARWLLAEGMDAAVMTRSIPMQIANDDALIAYGQNGEALRPEQGYPVRLMLPGVEGNASVKWLRRVEVADQPFMTREETSKYTDPLPDGTARMFSLVMDAKSIITEPSFPDRLDGQGWREIRGLAWSGRGRITRVEVSVDGGKQWQNASLDEPVLPKCHTRFRLPWEWKGQEAVLMSRATDETGYVQPTTAELLKARGPNTQYHFNNIRAWQVSADGTVRLLGGAA